MGESFKCPYCNEYVENTEVYHVVDNAFDGTTVHYVLGTCPKCKREFQWEEHYEMIFNGFTNVFEVKQNGRKPIF